MGSDRTTYQDRLAELFVSIAGDRYLAGSDENGVLNSRIARGLQDMADYVRDLSPNDSRLRALASFYPDPAPIPGAVAGRDGDPHKFRRDDPDERLHEFLEAFIDAAVDAWPVDDGCSDEFTAVPLVEMLESRESPLEWKLAAIAKLEDYVSFLEQWHVEEARDLGWSWQRIARPLRKTRQAVQQRWSADIQASL